MTKHEQHHPGHRVTFLTFLWRAAGNATDGSRLFYAWMFGLPAVALVGVNAWARQTAAPSRSPVARTCFDLTAVRGFLRPN